MFIFYVNNVWSVRSRYFSERGGVLAEKYFVLNRPLPPNGTEHFFSGCELFHTDEFSVKRKSNVLNKQRTHTDTENCHYFCSKLYTTYLTAWSLLSLCGSGLRKWIVDGLRNIVRFCLGSFAVTAEWHLFSNCRS